MILLVLLVLFTVLSTVLFKQLFLRPVLNKRPQFCVIRHICQRIFIFQGFSLPKDFQFRDFWEEKLGSEITGYYIMILWELIMIILMMAVFNFEGNLDRLVTNATAKTSRWIWIALKKYFRYLIKTVVRGTK